MFDHESLKVFFRGKFVDFHDANISIANTSFLYGLGVFTGMRAHYNEDIKKLYVFRPYDHYLRFRDSCKLMRYTNFLDNYTYDKFKDVLVELLKINSINQDAYIRVTNFTDENKVTPKLVGYRDSFSVFLYPLGDYVPTSGMRCKVSSWSRVEDNAIPARAKINGAYVNTAFAKTEALLGGYDEALVMDNRGHIVEGSAENIFVVMGGKIITPLVNDNILEGITRKTILEIAKNEGVEVVERSIDRSEIYKADEIFLTGTGAKISPVIDVDSYVIGDGNVGPISNRLQEVYRRAVRGEEHRYLRWLLDVGIGI